MPLKRGTHSRGMTGKRNHRDGFWRRLTCTEGSADNQDDHPYSSDDERLRRMAGITDGRSVKSSRRMRRAQDDATDKITIYSSSPDEYYSTSQRRHKRRNDKHRYSLTSGASGGRTSVMDKSQSKSARVNRSRRRKRLVVAMIEDGDDDGVTESTFSGGYTGRKMRVRTTRDERKNRHILRQLSARIRTSTKNQAEFDSPLKKKKSSVPSSSKSNGQPQALSSTQTPAECSPQPTPLTTPQIRLTLLPPQAETAATADAVSVQPSQLVQMNNQRLPQHLPILELIEQTPKTESTQHSYGVKHFPQPTQAVVDPVFRNGRHGYRLFRRVFSATDNYYAVPFSPLESVKLSKDDDQWEDLEIFVASHKGTETIKLKATQPVKKLTNLPKDHPVAAIFGKIPKFSAPTAASHLPPARPKLTETFGKLKLQQLPIKSIINARAAAAAKKSVSAAGVGHLMGNSVPQKKPVQPQLRIKKQPVTSQPPPGSSTRANNHSKVSKTHFNYMNRQQQIEQLHQQRRADPLSPHRLLNQLTQIDTKETSRLSTPSMLPRPKNTRASQIPLFRSEPTATSISGRIVVSNSCGKLNTKLLCGSCPK